MAVSRKQYTRNIVRQAAIGTLKFNCLQKHKAAHPDHLS